jgi:hypothetical protein
VFELTRGCDKYKDCMCHEDGRWDCAGKDVEDLCGQCRKCKIGDDYYEGDTTFTGNFATFYNQFIIIKKILPF